MSCNDILRNIRTSRKDTEAVIDYFHIDGHMDIYFADKDLTLEQWLNKKYNILAKRAVDKWIRLCLPHPGLQLLRREDAALIVDCLKVTGDVGDVVRFAKGKEEARAYLVGKKKWSNEKFDKLTDK